MRPLSFLCAFLLSVFACNNADSIDHEVETTPRLTEEQFVELCEEFSIVARECTGEPINDAIRAEARANCGAVWDAANAIGCTDALANTYDCVVKWPKETICEEEAAAACYLPADVCVGEYCGEHPTSPICVEEEG